jgi:hypothetical protein
MISFLKKKTAQVIRGVSSIILDEAKDTIKSTLIKRANLSSSTFIESHLSDALLFETEKQIKAFAAERALDLSSIIPSGGATCLEFGVYQGASLLYWSSHLPGLKVVGFDSFEGLSENWGGTSMPKGTFNLGGIAPLVPENVEIVKGWVEESLERYLTSNDLGTIALVHMDLDTFTPTKYVLSTIAPYLKRGSLILFDEYLGYPGWEIGEHKALIQSGLEVRYLAFSTGASQVNQALVEVV